MTAGFSSTGSAGSSSKLIRSGNGSECADAVAALVPAKVASDVAQTSSSRGAVSIRKEGALVKACAWSISEGCQELSASSSPSLLFCAVFSGSLLKGESSKSASVDAGGANCDCPDRETSEVAQGSTGSSVVGVRSVSVCSPANDVVGAAQGSLDSGLSAAGSDGLPWAKGSTMR